MKADTPEALDGLIDSFDAAWHRGGRPDPGDFLPDPGHPCFRAHLALLLRIDLEYRLKAGDPAPVVPGYLARFGSRLGHDDRLELLRQEYQGRWDRGEREVTRADYTRDYPEFAGALEELRPRWDCPACRREGIELADEGAAEAACPGCGAVFRRGTEMPPPPAGSGWPEVPGFAVEAEIGRGGMGAVYRARQDGGLGLNRLVALKVIKSGAEGSLPGRFLREARVWARLRHPNVVRLYDAGLAGDRPYLVLEYVSGGNLADRLKGEPADVWDAARVALALAEAVHYAHTHPDGRILHRDLKPANVLLDGPSGAGLAACVPKLTDFGLSKYGDTAPGDTETGMTLGTPAYMPPEQVVDAKAADARADVYSLGATLYELLTGRPPFQGASRVEVYDQVREQAPVPVRQLRPAVPRDLETVCLKCLRKEPHNRYGSAAELADDLRRFLAGLPVRGARWGHWNGWGGGHDETRAARP